MRSLHTSLAVGAFAFLLVHGDAMAFDLTVTSADGTPVGSYSSEQLHQMGAATIRTVTPWTDGEVEFKGVEAAAFLDTIASDAKTLTAIALDNYIIEIPTAVLREDGAIIASSLNGEPMNPADRGPFWIMFDFDDLSVERQTEFRNYSVWQLVEIQVD